MGVAVDAIIDSVSVATTFKRKTSGVRNYLLFFLRSLREHPELVKKYFGMVVPYKDNFFAA